MADRLPRVSQTSLGTLNTRASGGDPLAQVFVKWLKEHHTFYGFDGFNFKPAIIRGDIIDDLVKKYLEENPNATVVNAGCGFCTRYSRLNVPSTVKWIDLDLHELIYLRMHIAPPQGNYHLFMHDMSKPIPFRYDLLICEGILMYLRLEDAMKHLRGHVIFDVIGHKREPGLGAEQLWWFDDTEWNLDIIKHVQYDDPQRDAHIYWINQIRPLSRIKPTGKTKERSKVDVYYTLNRQIPENGN